MFLKYVDNVDKFNDEKLSSKENFYNADSNN